MFAHQVIEDFQNLKPESDKMYIKSVMLVKNMIPQTQKFHMGEYGKLHQFFPNLELKQLFLNEEVSHNIRLPYKNCWFDSLHKFVKTDKNSENYNVSKRGMLVTELQSDLIIVQICNFIDIPELGKPRWILGFQSYLIKIGSVIDKNLLFYNGPETNIIPSATSEMYYKQAQKDINIVNKTATDDSEDLWLLNMFLLFLSCKNIGTETVPAPVKLNNKRKKKGKLPIFSYKTLVIKPTKKQQQSIPKHLWNNRIHLSRGHWKTYTAEKPLLGKHVGRYWWQDHVRGQNHDGVVIKDYEVKTK